MLRRLLPFTLLLAVLAPRAAAEVSLGYSYLKYLEDGGGDTPLGFYLSFGRSGEGTSLELDLGYHHESGELEIVSLDTYTALAGPRWRSGSGVFVRLLGGLRYDHGGDQSFTSWGGAVGLGVDIKTGGSIKVRLGTDFQMFFDEGEDLKTLRVNAGITF